MEKLPRNPLRQVGNFKDPDALDKPFEYYTSKEYLRFFKVAREHAYAAENKRHSSIAFYTGARRGEIHALKWSDLQNGYLSVNRSIRQKAKDRISGRPRKTRLLSEQFRFLSP